MAAIRSTKHAMFIIVVLTMTDEDERRISFFLKLMMTNFGVHF